MPIGALPSANNNPGLPIEGRGVDSIIQLALR